MKTLSPLQAIKLVAIVTAVVSFGVWNITSHLDFAISWSIRLGADSYILNFDIGMIRLNDYQGSTHMH